MRSLHGEIFRAKALGITKLGCPRINKDIDKLVNFKGRTWGGTEINHSDILSRTLEIALPDIKLTPQQISAINASKIYAKSKGVDLIITVVR